MRARSKVHTLPPAENKRSVGAEVAGTAGITELLCCRHNNYAHSFTIKVAHELASEISAKLHRRTAKFDCQPRQQI